MTHENARFRAPASSPKQSPCNSQAAITMRFAATRAHPCSHYNAICIFVLQNTKREPITPGTIQTAPAAHTRYPYFHRWLQPLYTEKRKVSCAGFLPKTNPMQQSCSHYIAFCNNTCSNPHVSTHMATKPDKTLAPPEMTNVLLCDAKFHTTLHECIFM